LTPGESRNAPRAAQLLAWNKRRFNTVSGILGDYARSARIETFTESAVERHPTELAMLRGARLVSAIETEQGRRWAESRIKALTGGDRVAARFMRQDFFEYVPQFKLLIAGNHKPSLRSVDEAIRRRLHLIPFAITIPPAERDPALAGKLQAKWPAILAWMIEGCVEWQRQGLMVPPAVSAATSQYIEAEDAFGLWLGASSGGKPATRRPPPLRVVEDMGRSRRRMPRQPQALQPDDARSRGRSQATTGNRPERLPGRASHQPRLHRRSPLRRLILGTVTDKDSPSLTLG
jgi:hypothetical protein